MGSSGQQGLRCLAACVGFLFDPRLKWRQRLCTLVWCTTFRMRLVAEYIHEFLSNAAMTLFPSVRACLRKGFLTPVRLPRCVANCFCCFRCVWQSGTSSAAAYFPASGEAWGGHWVDAEHGGSLLPSFATCQRVRCRLVLMSSALSLCGRMLLGRRV